ncbi:MAG: hypothetical protein J0G96_00860 [Flavobacteriia bacterium]|nr:hypothetical protein [Flavobacteriia bacterium]OJX36122.1 MAG: hypothetical protein BGO87_06560 [Flavobacteriia bacterium 40-80]
MTFVVIFLILITAISLYEYFNSKDVKNIATIASKSLNKQHGAHEIQRYQTLILSAILGILIVTILLTSTIYDSMSFVSHVVEQTNPEKSDTMEVIFNLPPPQEEKMKKEIQTLAYKGNEGADVQNQVAQEEAKKSENPRENDSRENTSDNTPTKKYKSVEEEVRDFERQLFENASGNSERMEIQKQREELKKKKEKFEREQQERLTKSGSQEPVTSSKKGKTMVSYYLPNRRPHNNDINNVKNPGYTCEQGASGEIVIKIKVNSTGQVISATPASSYSELNPCLVEQAVKYAKMSRFDASSQSGQDGTITYIFMP